MPKKNADQLTRVNRTAAGLCLRAKGNEFDCRIEKQKEERECPPWESNPSCNRTPHRRNAEGRNNLRASDIGVKKNCFAESRLAELGRRWSLSPPCCRPPARVASPSR